MINYTLLKCAFGKHEYGRILHDDTTDRWVKVCKNCSAIVEVDAPRDENGEPIDSHVWVRMENDRSEKEFWECIEHALSLGDD